MDNWQKSKNQEIVSLNYRAAQIFHDWAQGTVHYLLPAGVAVAEVVIISGLFVAIRLNTYGTSTEERLLALVFLSVETNCFFVFKQCIEFASKVTDASRDFSRIPFLQKGSRYEHKDREFLASCKPLTFKVGETFTINRESFPTITMDIILGTLVNLLITF